MGKLTDKQVNMIILGVGVLLLLTFSVLSYLDYEEIDGLRGKLRGVVTEINKSLAKKREIPKLKSKLWLLHKKYEHFKEVLPTDKDYLKFYETLEQFRIKRKMLPWKTFRTEKVETEDKDNGNAKKKPAPRGRGRGKKPSGPLEQTAYIAAIDMTFDQLGQLLNFIERYDRYYAVTDLKISSMKVLESSSKLLANALEVGNDPIGAINLKLVTFAYTGKSPDKEVAASLGPKYKPDKKLQKKYDNLAKVWTKKSSFLWSRPKRNPFNKDEVLIPSAKTPQGPPIVKKEEKVVGPQPLDKVKEKLKELQKTRDFLHTLAVAESLIELDKQIKVKNYEKDVKQIVLTPQNDPDNSIRKRLQEMRKELKEWKKMIDDASRQKKARQLVESGKNKIREMQELYEKGKNKGSQELLKEVIKIHNEIMPQFREYKDLEGSIPELSSLRQRAEEYYSRADTQIRIIQLASKLNLRGIIFMKDTPELSVAFIDKKVVHKNDILMKGFVVHEIKEEKVILRYKEETVPIILKRGKKKAPKDRL